MTTALWIAAFLAVAVGIAHSYLGEKFILMRLAGVNTFKMRTLRFAWHITTVAWWGFAAILASAAQDGLTAFAVLRILAVTMFVTAAIILVASRGRHLAWPVFTVIGAIAWISAGS